MKRPKVGVGILVFKNGQVLLGRRKDVGHGKGEYAGKHYVDIGLVAQWKSGKPKVLEPQKATGWKWYKLGKLPKPMFQTINSYIEALKTGKNFFDG